MKRANDFAGYFIAAIVILSPIPFGSNPPFFWTLSGLIVGLVSTGYFLMALRSSEALRVPLSKLGVLILLWFSVIIWLCIQVLPLGEIWGAFQFQIGNGQFVQSHSLSVAPDSTLLMLVRTISYALVFSLAVQSGANERRSETVMTVIFWGIVAHAGYALVQLTQLGDTNLGFPKIAYLGNATGTFINRNSFATFLAVGLSLGAALIPVVILAPKARNARPGDTLFKVGLQLAGLFVIVIALLASQSRMGLFAGFAGLASVILLTLSRLPRAAITIPLAVVVGVLAFVAATWIFGQGVLTRALDLNDSTIGRLDLYQQVLKMIELRPWLGYGGGSFDVAFPAFFGPPLNLSTVYSKAHSTYLTLVVELGLPVAIIYLMLIVFVFIRLIWAQFVSREMNAARMAALAALVAVAFHSIVDFSLEIQANAFLLAAITGLGLVSTMSGSARRRVNM